VDDNYCSSNSCMSGTAGLFMGAIVGVVLGILYAPKSGRETRANLRDKAEVAIDRAKAAAETATEAAEKATQAVLALERQLEKKLETKETK
jgi:gas vesicle protein